jgi:arginyl-tRNA synthetase
VTIEDRLLALIREALVTAAPRLGIEGNLPEPELMAPRQREHGDFATNVALALASRAGRPPRDVAQAIADALPDATFLVKTEVAGPGFLNFFTTDEWLHEALREVVTRGAAYGRSEPNGLHAQVEFVSANPTGPLHVGHARNAALGDAIARLLEFTGWAVEREYYFNDAGRQVEQFGRSVEAR